MRYIFPRQFDLHNVFTSKVDTRETAMPFKDYTLREAEIHQVMCRTLDKRATDAEDIRRWKSRIPKRLRGAPTTLVNKLRTLNQRCSYTELLRHYCPVEVIDSLYLSMAPGLTSSGLTTVVKARMEEKPTTTERNSSSSCCRVIGERWRSPPYHSYRPNNRADMFHRPSVSHCACISLLSRCHS